MKSWYTLAAIILLTIGCGHKTHLRAPEPLRAQPVTSIQAELVCGKIILDWTPVFFDNRGNPLENSPTYIILRRRGGPVETTDDKSTPETIAKTEEAEAEANTDMNAEGDIESERDRLKPVLPVEFDYSLVAIIPGITATLKDPQWSSIRMKWEDTGVLSGPIWSLQSRKFKKPSDFPPVKDDDSPEDLTPVEGYNYYYMVIAVESDGTTSEPSQALQIPWIRVAGQPTHLQSNVEQTETTLTWESPEADCLGEPIDPPVNFEIHRKSGADDDFQLIGTIEDTRYTDSTISIDSIYEYKIRCLEKKLNIPGIFSDSLTVDTTDTFPPAVPTDLTGAISMLGVHLNWRQVPDDDLAGYRIYRKTGNNSEPVLLNPDKLIVSNTYNDEEISTGETYIYQITSVDKSAQMNESKPGKNWSVNVTDRR